MLSYNINLRKIGMMFLIFSLVFTGLGASLGTPVSYAASVEVYVASNGDDTTGDGTETAPYATLQKAYLEVTDGGTIYLLDDVILKDGVDVIVAINEPKHVTIATAPNANNTVMIKRGKPSGKVLFQLTNMSQITLSNIIIDGNSEEMGGAIDGRLFNVYGGSKLIIGEGAVLQNSFSQHQGSAIYTRDAGSIVEMNDGEIRGNKRSLIGAAIFVDPGAQFIMTGGHITNNIGGGVESRGGEIVLSDEANITGNAFNGKEVNVNLANYKTLILNGAFTGEAGVTTQSMTSGTQFGRVTEEGLGSVENLIADSGSLLASYDANKNLVWRAFKNDLSKPSTDGEVMGKKPTLTGVTEPFANVKIEIVSAADQSIIVSEEVTADENGNWELSVANALTAGAYTINVTANKNNIQSGTVTRQFEVSSDVYVSSGGSDTTGDGTRNNPYATLYKGYQEAVDGGMIYVMDNIALSVNAANKYLHLDQNKSVTISTASGADTAVIQRGSIKGAASGETGGDRDTLIYLEKGQLTLKNIIIDAKRGEDFYNGRIMNVYNDSKLIIEEGAVLRNSTSAYGGTAIYLDGDAQKGLVASIEMKGGEITGNNHSTSNAAAVLIVDNAQFIMTGGKITDNSGGGVDLSTNTNAQFVLSGTAQITGNRGASQPERNVILRDNTLLTLNDDFSGEAGVTAHNRMNVGNKFGEAARTGLTGLENLIADNNSNLYAAYGEGNALVWQLQVDPSTPLAAPSNVKVTGDQLTWDAVDNAGSYEVSITDNEGNIRPVAVPSGTELDLSTLEPPLAPGEYTITVTAKSNDPAYADSDASESVTYTVPTPATSLAAPSNVKVTGDQLTWDAVENAGSYEVSITDSEGNIRPVAVSSGTELDLSSLEPPLAPGEYTITVTAKSNDPAYADSGASESVTYTVPNGSGEVNKSELQKVVELSEGLTESDYTPESWANLELALARADSVLENPNATQADVDQALAELQKAMEDLVVLNGELEELNLVGLTNNGTRDIQLTPNFDPNKYNNYYGTVTNDVYGISLNPVAKNPDDTQIKIIVNDLEYTADQWNKLPLIEGENVITVGVYDKTGKLINEYTYIIVRERASGNDNSGGDNSGGGSTDGGSTGGTTTPSTPDNTVKPGNIVTTNNGSNVSFASGTVNGNQATVTIDKNKLSGILADGKGHKLGIRVPGNSDVEVRGLTLEDLKKLADTGSSLEIEDMLAIYPVPAGQLDVNAISKQFGNAPISDIAANIKIKRSADDLAKLASEKAAEGGYELLVHPVDLDLTFNHDGKTDRAGLLNGYAPKYIALPEGIDPNRITTGVIVNPDGSVFHVPTVVTKVNNRYFALINDLRSSGTYSVIWNPQDFEDVQYHWGRADVNNIAARLDLKGNGDNTFSPNRHVTRSEFAEIVVLGLGLMRQDAPQNIYPDVPSTAWYRNAVALADEFDIVRGYTDGNFKGSQQITREQGFAMIARAYRLIQSENVPSQEQIASTLARYADGDKVASWAKGDVAQLIAAGIIQGNGPDHLSPKAQMTRAEVTALIARMLKVTNLIDK